MNIQLTPDLEQFVRQRVASGEYPSADDVVRDGLQLLQQREESDQEELRKEIAVGIEQAERGELVDGEEVFRNIRGKLQQLSGQGQ